MKSKFVSRPYIVRLWYRLFLHLLHGFLSIFFVVVFPGPCTGTVFFMNFGKKSVFWISYECFSFPLTWESMGVKLHRLILLQIAAKRFQTFPELSSLIFKISKLCSSYKSQPIVFKLVLKNLPPIALYKTTLRILKFEFRNFSHFFPKV